MYDPHMPTGLMDFIWGNLQDYLHPPDEPPPTGVSKLQEPLYPPARSCCAALCMWCWPGRPVRLGHSRLDASSCSNGSLLGEVHCSRPGCLP